MYRWLIERGVRWGEALLDSDDLDSVPEPFAEFGDHANLDGVHRFGVFPVEELVEQRELVGGQRERLGHEPEPTDCFFIPRNADFCRRRDG